MKNETMRTYDALAELKRAHAGDENAARLLDALAERVEADGLDSGFIEWVGKILKK